MAFVFEEKREINVKKKIVDGGPGEYEKSDVDIKKVFKVDNTYKCTSSFMSKSRMRGKNKSVDLTEKKKKEITPGPGHYYLKGNFDAANKDNFLSYVQQNNNSYQFASQSEKTQDLVSLTVTPGPGSYEVNSQKQKSKGEWSKQKEVPSGLKIIQEIINRQEHVPSIPYSQDNQELLGYDLDSSNLVKKIINKLEPDQQRGPGRYIIKQDQFVHGKKKGAQFSQMKEGRRLTQKKEKDDKVGPGQYNLQEDIKAYKMKPSSVFESKSGRFNMENAKDPQQKKLDLLYKVAKLQNMDLVKQRVDLKRLSEEKYEDLVEKVEDLVEFVEESVPGPGYYQIKREFEDMPKSKGTMSLSNHRKASSRSRESRRIGPGSYNPQGQKRKDFSTHQAAFQSSQARDKEILNEGPGPGKYDVKGYSLKEGVIDKLVRTKLNNQFGVNERRFDENSQIKSQLEQQHLGPGAYHVQQPSKKDKDDQQSYVFKSGMQKLQYFQEESDSLARPCVGQYYLGQGDIKAQQDKVQQQQQFSKRKVPFTTNAKRFTPTAQHQSFNDTDLIHEQIEIDKKQNLKTSVDKNKCNSFQSKQPRFSYTQPNDTTIPLDLQPQWVKATHNVKFKPMFQSNQ